MRYTQAFIQTQRDTPKDAEAISHQLALRAGLVKQLSSGVYSYLPLGFRVLQNITHIIREEMNAAGGIEVLLPALHPAELWKKSGRFDALGDDKISFKNRAGHEFVLGPTHEEVITDLVGNLVKSFRDLPVTLYQIQTKFRDEARPRFGIIRTKEFIMKDGYSFDSTQEGLDQNYQKMSAAYHKIFTRCGLKFQVVTADSGLMGGKMSQEFMFECPYGEDKVAKSEGGYLASQEVAERKNPGLKTPAPSQAGLEKFETPNLRTIDEITKRFKLKPSQMIKTLIYVADDKPIAALVLGDAEVNEVKLRKLMDAKSLRLAEPHEIREATGAPVGFAGPVGMRLPIYADWDIQGGNDFVTGANEADMHIRNVNLDRDFTPTSFGDIRFVQDGDEAVDGSGQLKLTTTMEIGHIFKLGTRYTECLEAKFLDEKGAQHPIIMGCYGIGVNRILAAAIEEHHDDKGITWPKSIAPFDIVLLTMNQASQEVVTAAEKIYGELSEKFQVLYDDREERAGVKFKDADLIGIPIQVIIGDRNLKEGKVEVKDRLTGNVQLVLLDELTSQITSSS